MYNQYNQIEAILSQYEMEIYEVTKGRGIYICNTNRGQWVLTGFRGAKEKGELLRNYLANLKDAGFSVEQIAENKNGEAVTVDEVTGERFLLKEYISGTELNVNQVKELKEAAALLAQYHKIASQIDTDGVDKNIACDQLVVAEKEKHNKELIKVRNYIRNRKKKNEFERIFLNAHEPMLQTAKESIFILDKKNIVPMQCCICHGDYNQHNIVYVDHNWKVINFENFTYRWCIWDLANFLRKMQEKNEWDIRVGDEILESYMRIRPLEQEEYEKLYGLLLFPEKFWKITNHYMNSRKTWISERDIEKLKKVIEQEGKRLNFVENLFSIRKE